MSGDRTADEVISDQLYQISEQLLEVIRLLQTIANEEADHDDRT